MSYIEMPFEDDPDALFQEAVDRIRARFPNWEPQEGDLTTAMLEEHALLSTVAAGVAALVPRAIFREFGTLVSVQPIEAVPATAPSTWTMIDNAGYTIEAGTVVAFQVAGDELVAFEVSANVVVAPGNVATAAGAVQLVALEPGTAANGIAAGPMIPIDILSNVATVATTAPTAGGIDAETDAQYLDRLSQELQLLTPRPILGSDFAVLARRVAGVKRAVGIDGYWPGRVIANGVTANGSNILQAATAQFVATDVGRTVTGAGIPGGATITGFTDATHVTLSANATATANPVAVTLGALTNQERVVSVAALDLAGAPVDGATKTAIAALLEAEREANFIAPVVDPTVTNVPVTVTVVAEAGADPATVKANVVTVVKALLDPKTWPWSPTVRRNQLIATIGKAALVAYVDVLAAPAADVALPGVAPVATTNIVAGDVTVL